MDENIWQTHLSVYLSIVICCLGINELGTNKKVPVRIIMWSITNDVPFLLPGHPRKRVSFSASVVNAAVC